MTSDGRRSWLTKTRRTALVLSAALLPLMAFAASPAHAQSIMRTPNLNVGARTPSINPTITPRINPSVAARPNVTADRVARTPPTRALVRFTPEARVSDITALLDNYQASIVDGAKGGMFRLQFGKAMSKDEAAGLLVRLQREKIVSLAVATP